MDVYKKAKGFLENRDLDSSFKFFTDFINSQLSSGTSGSTEELADAYNSRGHIRYLWVEFDDAISDYSAAIELDPTFAVSYYNRGQVHYRLGRYKQAETDLQKCLELDPSFQDAKVNLEQVKIDIQKNCNS